MFHLLAPFRMLIETFQSFKFDDDNLHEPCMNVLSLH